MIYLQPAESFSDMAQDPADVKLTVGRQLLGRGAVDSRAL